MDSKDKRLQAKLYDALVPYLRKQTWAFNFHKVYGKYRSILVVAVDEIDHKDLRALKIIISNILQAEPYVYTVTIELLKEPFVSAYLVEKEVRNKKVDDRLFSYLDHNSLYSTEDEVDCAPPKVIEDIDTEADLMMLSRLFTE